MLTCAVCVGYAHHLERETGMIPVGNGNVGQIVKVEF